MKTWYRRGLPGDERYLLPPWLSVIEVARARLPPGMLREAHGSSDFEFQEGAPPGSRRDPVKVGDSANVREALSPGGSRVQRNMNTSIPLRRLLRSNCLSAFALAPATPDRRVSPRAEHQGPEAGPAPGPSPCPRLPPLSAARQVTPTSKCRFHPASVAASSPPKQYGDPFAAFAHGENTPTLPRDLGGGYSSSPPFTDKQTEAQRP